MKNNYFIKKNIGNYIKKWLKLVYGENKVVKIFLYYMRDEIIFAIYNNLKNHSYMISCNLVKSSWQDIVFHLYMASNNPVKALG